MCLCLLTHPGLWGDRNRQPRCCTLLFFQSSPLQDEISTVPSFIHVGVGPAALHRVLTIMIPLPQEVPIPCVVCAWRGWASTITWTYRGCALTQCACMLPLSLPFSVGACSFPPPLPRHQYLHSCRMLSQVRVQADQVPDVNWSSWMRVRATLLAAVWVFQTEMYLLFQ